MAPDPSATCQWRDETWLRHAPAGQLRAIQCHSGERPTDHSVRAVAPGQEVARLARPRHYAPAQGLAAAVPLHGLVHGLVLLQNVRQLAKICRRYRASALWQ